MEDQLDGSGEGIQPLSLFTEMSRMATEVRFTKEYGMDPVS